MKNILVQHVESLLTAAKNRKTSQGVKIYELALEQLRKAKTDSEVTDVLSRLKEALQGIETHGFFTVDEHRIVEKIQALS